MKYNCWVTELWEDVFDKYLDKMNVDCRILDYLKMCSGGPISGAVNGSPFRVFLNSFPLFSKIEKLRHKIRLTLEKHEVEYRKKQVEDFKKSNQVTLYHTRKSHIRQIHQPVDANQSIIICNR
jgi:hypothetical protein